MKTLMLIASLAVLSGCATAVDFLNPRSTVPCYQSAEGQSSELQSKDFSECRVLSYTPNQHVGCMNLRGYKLAVCDRDSGEFVSR